MWLDVAPEFLESDQMRNLVDQCYRKPVFIQASVDCDLVFSRRPFAVISMTGMPFVDDFQVYVMLHDQVIDRSDGVFREIFLENGIHGVLIETCRTFPL